MKLVYALLFSLAFLLPGAVSAATPSGFCVTIDETATAGATSGVELEASSTGKGFYVIAMSNDDPLDIWWTISDASLFDSSVADATPSVTWGSPTTVAREGQDSGGALPALNTDFTSRDLDTTPQNIIWIPPGKFLTFRQEAVNIALEVSICIREAR
jgi:hypothetical protein